VTTVLTRPRVHLFVGPSVPPADLALAGAAIDGLVTIAPPVQQGDLLRLLADPPDVVGIVDGYFFQVPAVLHKEILLLLERGVRVLGAASLGALRAAELDRFGMEGIGQIYRLYRDGAIDADDEVAVLHAEQADGYRPLTLPLVTIRHNLTRARRNHGLSARAARIALASARRLHFSKRTLPAIVHDAQAGGVEPADLAALAQVLGDEAVDLKRQDALALIDVIMQQVRDTWPWPRVQPVVTRRTRTFEQHVKGYVGRAVGAHHIPDALVLSLLRLLSPDLSTLQQRIARRCLAIDEATARGLTPASDEALLARFRRQHDLIDASALACWRRARYLTPDELAAHLRDEDRVQRLLATLRVSDPACADDAAFARRIVADASARTGLDESLLLGPPFATDRLTFDGQMIAALKLGNRFGAGLAATAQIVEANAAWEARDPRFRLERLKRGRVLDWCAARWGIALDDLDQALVARGFDAGEFEHVARRVYAGVRFGPPTAPAIIDGLSSMLDESRP
jgi:hypothetical protein